MNMQQRVLECDIDNLRLNGAEYITALEAGQVLHIRNFPFAPQMDAKVLYRPELLAPKSRNISLGADGRLKGAAGSEDVLRDLAGMITRFRGEAESLLDKIAPEYSAHLRRGATSFRPSVVEQRVQSWRADDRRLHVDAFPSRPNEGARLLRVFMNINPNGVPRVWRLGEPFGDIAKRFMPRLKPYSRWQASLLHKLGITKSFRTEYDHTMLQLHDAMKGDLDYQRDCPQETVEFPPGSVWICFSDQAAHAAMAGQFLLEYTAQLPPARQYDYEASPLATLTRMKGHALV
jgi:hypothetical protein